MEADHIFYLKDVISATHNARLLNRHLGRLMLHDRELWMRAQYTVLGRVGICTVIGLSSSISLAIRLRRSTLRLAHAFASARRPASVDFANAREGTYSSHLTAWFSHFMLFASSSMNEPWPLPLRQGGNGK